MTAAMRTIVLPEDLCAAAEQRYRNRFSTVEELITLVLTEITRQDETKLDVEEERIVEERLRDLGYL